MRTLVSAVKIESPAAATAKTETPKARSTSRNDESNAGFAEILTMLKLIHGEMAETKDTIKLLTRRVGVVEDKIDALLSRCNVPTRTLHLEEQLCFETRSIGSLPINRSGINWDNKGK